MAMQALCAGTVIEKAIELAVNGTDPMQVELASAQLVATLYNKGNCSPTI